MDITQIAQLLEQNQLEATAITVSASTDGDASLKPKPKPNNKSLAFTSQPSNLWRWIECQIINTKKEKLNLVQKMNKNLVVQVGGGDDVKTSCWSTPQKQDQEEKRWELVSMNKDGVEKM